GIPAKEISIEESNQGLMYFSYITLLTIGYGDIAPTNTISRNAVMFLGLVGQFYMVILTAIVVGKFLYQSNNG
ncbi:potassium channel family protein, partial [Muriicola sp.]|uniref:potassium channel family protein n=1 Tax=Muriicola sp. TaxID=2020856 RepID=UPI003C730151